MVIWQSSQIHACADNFMHAYYDNADKPVRNVTWVEIVWQGRPTKNTIVMTKASTETQLPLTNLCGVHIFLI